MMRAVHGIWIVGAVELLKKPHVKAAKKLARTPKNQAKKRD